MKMRLCEKLARIVHLLCYVLLAAHARRNVLFLVVDDLRPQLSAYEGHQFPASPHPRMHTPNLDALAARSLLLTRAYVQQASCSPSRTSFLTGRRPDSTHVYDLQTYFREVGANFTTLPEYFKQHGYRTLGMGKVFHRGKAAGNNDPPSWTEPYFPSPPELNLNRLVWHAATQEERSKHPLPDEMIAEHAKQVLHRLAEEQDGKPFFMAVGFNKPHLPFIFPEEFLDFYPLDDIQVPDNHWAPKDLPEMAWVIGDGVFHKADIKPYNVSGNINTTLPDATVKELSRAYYSCVSYTDSLIGDVLRTLNEVGLGNNTIISFIGDHGFHLGEHGIWTKFTNFELSLHTPMMIHIPGLTDRGLVSEHIVEFVDLFPTLVEAADLPHLPLCPEDSSEVRLCREGVSMMPLMQQPPGGLQWKDAAFSQNPRAAIRRESSLYMKMERVEHMGYSVRTHRFRYTEWVGFDGFHPVWEQNYGAELYNHESDPQENHNLVSHPDYQQEKQVMRLKLHGGWRAALPPEKSQARRQDRLDL